MRVRSSRPALRSLAICSETAAGERDRALAAVTVVRGVRNCIKIPAHVSPRSADNPCGQADTESLQISAIPLAGYVMHGRQGNFMARKTSGHEKTDGISRIPLFRFRPSQRQSVKTVRQPA